VSTKETICLEGKIKLYVRCAECGTTTRKHDVVWYPLDGFSAIVREFTTFKIIPICLECWKKIEQDDSEPSTE